jgi:hypothetical protein
MSYDLASRLRTRKSNRVPNLGCSDLVREEERLPSLFNVGATADGDGGGGAQPRTVS